MGLVPQLSIGKGKVAEWVGVLGAPTLWLIELNVVYWLVPAACEAQQPLMVTAASVVFLGLTAGIGFLAWRTWRRAGREWPSSTHGDMLVQRSRFMAVVGLLTTAMFALFIIGDLIPTLIIHPCYK